MASIITSSTPLNINVGGNTSLAVSSSGVTVPSMNGGQLAGMRNKIINGGMAVAQRGNVALSNNTILYGGADRWMTGLFNFTTASGTIGQLAGQPITSSSTGFMHILSGLTTTGTGIIHFRQRIEAVNSFGLNGKTITVSGNVAQDTGSPQSLVVRLNKANSVDNFSATTLIANSSSMTVNTGVVTKFTATFTLSATDASNGVELVLEYAGVGAVTSKSFHLADFQLEIGSVATPFEQRFYPIELILSQRYYERIGGRAISDVNVVGYMTGASVFNQMLSYKVTKRTIPWITKVGTWYVANCGQPAVTGIGFETFNIYSTATATGQAYFQTVDNSTYIDISAEL